VFLARCRVDSVAGLVAGALAARRVAGSRDF
jgi:hypothetical protein